MLAHRSLEVKLQGKLNLSGVHCCSKYGSELWRTCRAAGLSEDGMVRNIEEFGPELKMPTLSSDRYILKQTKIPIVDPRPAHDISSGIPETEWPQARDRRSQKPMCRTIPSLPGHETAPRPNH